MAVPTVPQNLRVTPASGVGKRLLRDTDIQYLGAFRFPSSGTDLSFSYGSMTARKVNGQVRILILGPIGNGDPLYEFADPGTYSKVISQAPKATLIKNWGNIYGQARKTWYTTGVEKVNYPRYMGSLHWNESKQLLYWTYYDTYNTTGDEDWSLGATQLPASGSAVAFGPWRVAGPTGSGKKGVWKCVRISEHPTTGELLCGSIIMSGNHSAPWGPNIWVGPWPTEITPAGFGAPDIPIQKYLTYPGMIGRINRDGSWTGNISSARRPGDYIFEPLTSGVLTEIDPLKNNGVGSWTQVDILGGNKWIDLPDRYGMMFMGKLGSGHVWYRNAGVGNDLCTHGVASPVNITGPVSTDAYPFTMIFDPADLEAVKAGTKADYTVDAKQTINLQAAHGIQTSTIDHIGSAKFVGDSYFDPATRKLYVCAPEADKPITSANYFIPLVHVFQIN